MKKSMTLLMALALICTVITTTLASPQTIDIETMSAAELTMLMPLLKLD